MKKILLGLMSLVLASSLAVTPVAAQAFGYPAQQQPAQPTLWQEAVDYVNQWSIMRRIHDFFYGKATGQSPEQITRQLMQRAQQLPNLTPMEQRQEVAEMTRQSAGMLSSLPADQQQEIQRMATQFSHMSPQDQQAQAMKLIQQSQTLIQGLPAAQQRQLQQQFAQAAKYLNQAQEQQRGGTSQTQGAR